MSQNDLRNMLICVLKNGLVAKTIAECICQPKNRSTAH